MLDLRKESRKFQGFPAEIRWNKINSKKASLPSVNSDTHPLVRQAVQKLKMNHFSGLNDTEIAALVKFGLQLPDDLVIEVLITARDATKKRSLFDGISFWFRRARIVTTLISNIRYKISQITF